MTINTKKFITYTNSVYDIGENFKRLKRKNDNAKTSVSTIAKISFCSFLTDCKCVHEYQEINSNKKLQFKMMFHKDAKGLFENRNSDFEYEIVEIITTKKIKRELSSCKIGEKVLINEYTQNKKNSKVYVKIYEKVITRKEVWSDLFELKGYKESVRVVRSLEKTYKNGKEIIQEIYAVTNMLNHDIETILKIMHARWNIENCGFRTLKQRYYMNHLFIGELNAINYIVQMIFLVFNLLELYTKFRLKEKISVS